MKVMFSVRNAGLPMYVTTKSCTPETLVGTFGKTSKEDSGESVTEAAMLPLFVTTKLRSAVCPMGPAPKSMSDGPAVRTAPCAAWRSATRMGGSPAGLSVSDAS